MNSIGYYAVSGQQTEYMYKKTLGIGYEKPGRDPQSETLSSLPYIFNNQIIPNNIPLKAPLLVSSTNIVNGGTKFTTSDPNIVFYEYLPLKGNFNSAYQAFLYDVNDPDLNLTTLAIPSTYDPGGSYNIKVYARKQNGDFTPVLTTDTTSWIFDNATGCLTFTNVTWNETYTSPNYDVFPYISFYRYVGDVGLGSSSQWDTTTTNGNNIYYNTGNVGIGTNDPGYTLDVSGTTQFNSFPVCSSSSSPEQNQLVNKSYVVNNFVDKTTSQDITGIKTFSSSLYLKDVMQIYDLNSPFTNYTTLSAKSNAFSIIQNYPNGSVQFYCSDATTEVQTFISFAIANTSLVPFIASTTATFNGNVGIGKDPSSDYALDVSGNVQITMTNTTFNRTNGYNGQTYVNFQPNVRQRFYFGDMSNVSLYTAYDTLYFTSDRVGSTIGFNMRNGTTEKDVLLIKYDGIDVSGNIKVTQDLDVSGSTQFNSFPLCSADTSNIIDNNQLVNKVYVDNNFVDRTNSLMQNINGLKTFTNNTNFTSSLLARTNLTLYEWDNQTGNTLVLNFPMKQTIALRVSSGTTMSVQLPALTTNERGMVFTFVKLSSNVNVTLTTGGLNNIYTLNALGTNTTTNTTLLSEDKIMTTLAVGFYGETIYWIEVSPYSTFDRDIINGKYIDFITDQQISGTKRFNSIFTTGTTYTNSFGGDGDNLSIYMSATNNILQFAPYTNNNTYRFFTKNDTQQITAFEIDYNTTTINNSLSGQRASFRTPNVNESALQLYGTGDVDNRILFIPYSNGLLGYQNIFQNKDSGILFFSEQTPDRGAFCIAPWNSGSAGIRISVENVSIPGPLVTGGVASFNDTILSYNDFRFIEIGLKQTGLQVYLSGTTLAFIPIEPLYNNKYEFRTGTSVDNYNNTALHIEDSYCNFRNNVGIGKVPDTNNYALDVSGNVQITMTNTTFNRTNGYNGQTYVNFEPNVRQRFYFGDGNSMGLYTLDTIFYFATNKPDSTIRFNMPNALSDGDVLLINYQGITVNGNTRVTQDLDVSGSTQFNSFPLCYANNNTITDNKQLVNKSYVESYVDTAISTIVSSQWTTDGNNIYYNDGNDGNVGIGTNNPSYKLDVSGTIHTLTSQNTPALQCNSGNSTVYLIPRSDSGSFNSIVQLNDASIMTTNVAGGGTGALCLGVWNGTAGFRIDQEKITINGKVTATAFISTSDYRVKENIEPLDNTFNVDNLKPVKYNLKSSKELSTGFIAHELQEEFPFLVQGEKDGKDIQAINYSGLISILVKEIQDLKKEVSNMKVELFKLKK
jgi:hypothetical protein